MASTSREPSFGTAGETIHGATVVAPVDSDLRTGMQIAGYRLDELVGRGGMGVVYRAHHVHLGRTAALKLLSPQLSNQAGFRERFAREARIAASIHHPNVVTIYDAGEAEGLLYLAMQYVDGPDLGALLEQGRLEPAETLAILEQIAGGLDAAHALGVVHRDVKPGNVLVDQKRCYLTDFGLTRRVASTSALTQHDQFVGTLDYVAPEQIAGDPVDPRADVYSLGCLLFQMLAGEVPFPRPSQVAVIYAHLQERPRAISAQRTELPEAIDDVLAKALSKRPDDRFESCAELVAAARDALAVGGGRPAELHLLRRPPLRPALIATSQASLGATVRGMLGGERFSYENAGDGAEAVAIARDRLPEVVVLDWELPGVPAPEVCRALRADPRTARTRVVAVAPRGAEPSEHELERAGADALLVRPFSSLQLQLTVGGLLDPAVRSSG